ncbi:MAG TPA: hypothetical protein VGO93_20210 [Candidatus Xenobia bacterium]|jgi:hypothetical protein
MAEKLFRLLTRRGMSYKEEKPMKEHITPSGNTKREPDHQGTARIHELLASGLEMETTRPLDDPSQ